MTCLCLKFCQFLVFFMLQDATKIKRKQWTSFLCVFLTCLKFSILHVLQLFSKIIELNFVTCCLLTLTLCCKLCFAVVSPYLVCECSWLNLVSVFSTVWVRPVSSLYRMCSMPQLKLYCVSASSTTSSLTFDIDYIGCPFSRELDTKCVSWCTSVCIRLHQHTSLNCAHRCLNQSIVVTSVQLLGVTLQFHAPEQNEIRPKMFCCFWSSTLEFTPIVCSWSITDTDSVLCASEDCVILQSIRNTSIAPTWQFRL